METIIGVLLIIMAVFLIISVLMQSSKNHRLSGSIAGGAETFFGKQKGKTMDALFNKLTTIVTIIFVLLVLALYVMQPSEEALLKELMPEQDITAEGENAPEAGDETADGAADGAEIDGTETDGAAEVVPEADDTTAEPETDAETAPVEEEPAADAADAE